MAGPGGVGKGKVTDGLIGAAPHENMLAMSTSFFT
jgi:hypothetical protein